MVRDHSIASTPSHPSQGGTTGAGKRSGLGRNQRVSQIAWNRDTIAAAQATKIDVRKRSVAEPRPPGAGNRSSAGEHF
jgi:hypothetical protein